jgi:hypothetical protein
VEEVSEEPTEITEMMMMMILHQGEEEWIKLDQDKKNKNNKKKELKWIQ